MVSHIEFCIPEKHISSKNIGEALTFIFNSEYSLFKLLFTPALLYEGTPLQLLRLDLFGINFPFHPCSQFTFLTFFGQENITRGKVHKSHERALPPILTNPATLPPPPTDHLSSTKVSNTCASRRFALLHADGGIFPLRFAKFAHLVLTSLLSW